MLCFNWYAFSDLSTEQLYAVLKLRSEVFVVEQHCLYLDPDGKDPHALHLLATLNRQLIGYLRLFPPTENKNYLVFGRIVTTPLARAKGYGHQLMQALLHYCHLYFPAIKIECSAQYRLKNFYEKFGFTAYGNVYNEDNMPHIAMKKLSYE